MHSVKVIRKENTTKDSVILTLDIPLSYEEDFAFEAGQYLTLQANIEGEKVRRSYSLCSSPLDKQWKVGIKKIEGGKFSTYANDTLKAGDSLLVAPPKGNFKIDLDPCKDRDFIFFAAGSGITPILSMVKTYLAVEPLCRVKLFYTNRTVSNIMLKEELEAMKNTYLDRFELFYFLTRQSRNIPLLDGRIDKDKLDALVNTKLLPIVEGCHYFSCGPEAMVNCVSQFLQEKGIKKHFIHFELFHSSGPDDAKLEKIKSLDKGQSCSLTVNEGGKKMHFNITKGGDSILDAALNNSADLPYACKGGVCSTCKAKVIKGDVEMLLSYGLEQDEIDAGYVLTCQTWPISDEVEVDFDI